MQTHKKAFTLAETIITLVIVGVLMALMSPMIPTANDKRKILCKTAYKMLKISVGEAIASNTTAKLLPSGTTGFCTSAATTLNVIPDVLNCDAGQTLGFIANNDIAFIDFNQDFSTAMRTVRVDVDGINHGPDVANTDVVSFNIYPTGEIVPTPGSLSETYITCNVTMNSYNAGTEGTIQSKLQSGLYNWTPAAVTAFTTTVATKPTIFIYDTPYKNKTTIDSDFAGISSLTYECQ